MKKVSSGFLPETATRMQISKFEDSPWDNKDCIQVLANFLEFSSTHGYMGITISNDGLYWGICIET